MVISRVSHVTFPFPQVLPGGSFGHDNSRVGICDVCFAEVLAKARVVDEIVIVILIASRCRCLFEQTIEDPADGVLLGHFALLKLKICRRVGHSASRVMSKS